MKFAKTHPTSSNPSKMWLRLATMLLRLALFGFILQGAGEAGRQVWTALQQAYGNHGRVEWIHLVFFREGTAMFAVNRSDPGEVLRYRSQKWPCKVIGEEVIFDASQPGHRSEIPLRATYDAN